MSQDTSCSLAPPTFPLKFTTPSKHHQCCFLPLSLNSFEYTFLASLDLSTSFTTRQQGDPHSAPPRLILHSETKFTRQTGLNVQKLLKCMLRRVRYLQVYRYYYANKDHCTCIAWLVLIVTIIVCVSYLRGLHPCGQLFFCKPRLFVHHESPTLKNSARRLVANSGRRELDREMETSFNRNEQSCGTSVRLTLGVTCHHRSSGSSALVSAGSSAICTAAVGGMGPNGQLHGFGATLALLLVLCNLLPLKAALGAGANY